jgi:hypothetical protein
MVVKEPTKGEKQNLNSFREPAGGSRALRLYVCVNYDQIQGLQRFQDRQRLCLASAYCSPTCP